MSRQTISLINELLTYIIGYEVENCCVSNLFPKPKREKTSQETWVCILMVTPNVTETMAWSIAAKYPTCMSLYNAAMKANTNAEKQTLIHRTVQWVDDLRCFSDDTEMAALAKLLYGWENPISVFIPLNISLAICDDFMV